MNKTHNIALGIFGMVSFCFLATLGDGTLQFATRDDGNLHFVQILFVRCVVGSLILLPFAIKTKRVFVPKPIFKIHVARGITAFLAALVWLYAIKHAELSSVIAVGFTAPLFATLLAVVFLGEHISRTKIAALLIGFCGAMIVVNPFDANVNVYLIFALCGAVFWASTMVLTKKLAGSEPPISIAFYYGFMMIPFAFAGAAYFWIWPSPEQWFYILSFTLLNTFAQIAMAFAFKHADLTILMPFEFTALLFGAAVSYLLFGEVAPHNTFLGGAVILASGYIILQHQRRVSKQNQQPLI